jgi:CobQ-like glutamine amidotransferase family enzyme
LKQNKAKSSPTRKPKRISLIGNSHMCGCASELGKYLGPDYQVSGTVMPGSRLQNITKLSTNEIVRFSKEDTVIILGGSNDVNRNESMRGLMNLNEFVDQRNNKNTMIVTIAHRHDLLATSYINNDVQIFNKKLYKITKNKDNVRILDHEPT